MKIKGFTLAEVLIVLTILGVIAALTMPALNANIQKQQVGPALMRAISTLDTANALVAQERDFYSFAESCHNYLNDCFEPFVKEKLGAAKFDENINYGAFNNPSTTALTPRNGYVTKNGIVYYIEDYSFDNDNIIFVQIDVNGNKRPNIYAKDLFEVLLIAEDDGCKIYPFGSKILKEYANSHGLSDSIYTGTWDEPYTGPNGSACNADGVAAGPVGLYCAGSIVDNGGRVIYPW